MTRGSLVVAALVALAVAMSDAGVARATPPVLTCPPLPAAQSAKDVLECLRAASPSLVSKATTEARFLIVQLGPRARQDLPQYFSDENAAVGRVARQAFTDLGDVGEMVGWCKAAKRRPAWCKDLAAWTKDQAQTMAVFAEPVSRWRDAGGATFTFAATPEGPPRGTFDDGRGQPIDIARVQRDGRRVEVTLADQRVFVLLADRRGRLVDVARKGGVYVLVKAP